MPDDSDYIRMRGHINRVKSEFPTLDPELIERICQHFILVRRSRRTFKKMRAYVVELISDHDEPTLRGMLGMSPKTNTGASGRRRTEIAAGGQSRRPRGRPGWTAELFWDRYREACERAGQPHVYRTIAAHFLMLHGERGTDAEYLRKLVRRYGLPPG
jgi:hypothetical protein